MTWHTYNTEHPGIYALVLPVSQFPQHNAGERCCSQGYQLGETKVFLRAGQMASLDKIRTEVMYRAAVTIQRHIHGFVQRRQYARKRHAALTLQA